MKIPKVDNFFGCCTLETGGLIIGWFHLVSNIIAFIVGAIFFILACLFNCDELHQSTYGETKEEDDDAFYCSFGRGLFFFIAILLMIFASVFIAISHYCIKGTKNRNHLHIKPMMITMLVVAILSFLEIFSLSAKSLGSGLVKCALYGYLFVVLYSLYSVFKEEGERGVAPQYQAPVREKV